MRNGLQQLWPVFHRDGRDAIFRLISTISAWQFIVTNRSRAWALDGMGCQAPTS